MNFILVIVIAIGLSMDTFSLSLVYGTLGMSKREKYVLSFMVGIFHFFMPLLGFYFSSLVLKFVNIDFDVLVCLILSFIGLEMVIGSFKDEVNLNVSSYFLFALAVSIDSFSVGITLNGSDNIIIGPLIFCLMSFIFTLFGLFLGGKTYKLFGKISTIIGGVILILVGLFYIF